MSDAVAIPAGCCPGCDRAIDTAGVANGTRASPVPGDYSVCVRCGSLLRFIEGLRLRLRRMIASLDALEASG